MRLENRRRDQEQGLRVRENQIDTSQFKGGDESADWRFFESYDFGTIWGIPDWMTRALHSSLSMIHDPIGSHHANV
jgi:hypothetical protein